MRSLQAHRTLLYYIGYLRSNNDKSATLPSSLFAYQRIRNNSYFLRKWPLPNIACGTSNNPSNLKIRINPLLSWNGEPLENRTDIQFWEMNSVTLWLKWDHVKKKFIIKRWKSGSKVACPFVFEMASSTNRFDFKWSISHCEVTYNTMCLKNWDTALTWLLADIKRSPATRCAHPVSITVPV